MLRRLKVKRMSLKIDFKDPTRNVRVASIDCMRLTLIKLSENWMKTFFAVHFKSNFRRWKVNLWRQTKKFAHDQTVNEWCPDKSRVSV